MNNFSVVGKPVIRADSYDKATGRSRYVADMKIPGLAYASILHSPVAHAVMKKIDISEAASVPGVVGIITYNDVPDIPYSCCGHPRPFDTPLDTYILNKHVRYVGDPIAAVAAESKEAADEAVSKIKIEYDELPCIVDAEEALKDGAFEIHEGSHNIIDQNEYEIGDVDTAFKDAAYIFEDTIDTPIVTHSQMETHTSLVEQEPGSGRLIIHIANQVPNIIRERTAYALGLKMKDIKVIKGVVGGGFGGKQEPVFEIINCLLTMKTKRPVLLETTREECIAMTRTRHAMHITLRSALDENYRFIGREVRIVSNGGAYSSHGHNVVMNIATQAGMLYPTPNLKFTAVTAYTNILIGGAMRGYGIPQWTFAMETHVDNIANELGMDPYKFREINIYKPGDPVYMENMHVNSCALPEMMKKGAEEIGWNDFEKTESCNNKVKRGIGMACCSYAQSCYPHSVEMSSARIKVNEDGSITLMCGCADIGQGIDTGLSQFAAEAVGVTYDSVHMLPYVDTDISPFDPGAFASRQLSSAGNAVKKAGLACKKDILDFAAEDRKLSREKIDLREGFLIDKESHEKICSIEDVTMKMYYSCPKAQTIDHEACSYPTDNSLTFGTSYAIVEVDEGTGAVRVEKLRTYLDCGTVVNPLLAVGQLYGGAMMSYGYGLSEQLLINPKTGKVYNDNLLDYKVPTMADYPDIGGGFFESYEPIGAYGNKSLGEPPNLAPAAAIRNAVVNATGVEMNRLPLTPERVWDYLHPEEKENDHV